MDKPGFGWGASPGRRRDVFTLLQGEVFGGGEEDPSVAGRLLNRLLGDESIVDPLVFGEQWQSALASGLHDHPEELTELLSTSKSNGRQIRWDVMRIGSNVSFSLHAHPNVELIFVVKGAIHEYRYTAKSLPKTNFDPNDDEGPDLSSASPSTSSSSSSSSSSPLFIHQSASTGGFIVNSKGSIHLSFTKEDRETILLVLWSGKHALLPLEHQPPSGVLPALPDEVIPLSKYSVE